MSSHRAWQRAPPNAKPVPDINSHKIQNFTHRICPSLLARLSCFCRWLLPSRSFSFRMHAVLSLHLSLPVLPLLRPPTQRAPLMSAPCVLRRCWKCIRSRSGTSRETILSRADASTEKKIRCFLFGFFRVFAVKPLFSTRPFWQFISAP